MRHRRAVVRVHVYVGQPAQVLLFDVHGADRVLRSESKLQSAGRESRVHPRTGRTSFLDRFGEMRVVEE